jgi:hypothetical protein
MLTTSHIQAPAGLFCDASSGRRTGISARGYVRCPILDLVQDLPGERSNALPGIMVLPAGHVPSSVSPRCLRHSRMNVRRLVFGFARTLAMLQMWQHGCRIFQRAQLKRRLRIKL